VGSHEQDGNKFNRGQALNVAAMWTIQRERDPVMLVMHDVDLIPSVAHFERAYMPLYEGGVELSHLASAWTKYNYPTFLGGVLAIDSRAFVAVGGMPCGFFGWGGEDDVFYDRLKRAGLLERRVPPLEKDPLAYNDLESVSEWKRRVPKEKWMNLSKRELLRWERSRPETPEQLIELSRRANRTLTATSMDGKNTTVAFTMHGSGQ
jgi:hypothetical protein